ncbi:hypothetical protein [Paenibacillus donghaensis]|uniref:Uncharacterized protein n=1 Tax=Paenibacillus donghaensis TaxID=414771 RepID=A0A2Z2KBZ8_9BACL|nr:hypothetical protein [Paenibacillus donghaensis]ASA19399.1 hypothetical protein B9T62_00130 [Paenibacillus donghaensis]
MKVEMKWRLKAEVEVAIEGGRKVEGKWGGEDSGACYKWRKAQETRRMCWNVKEGVDQRE